jgi:putative heme-binding domain-containing protein
MTAGRPNDTPFAWKSLILLAAVFANLASTVLAQSTAPRTTAIWPSGPLEVFVSLDRPIDAAMASTFVNQPISYSEPGKTDGKATITIAGVQILDNGRTLSLATDPHSAEALYHLPWPGSAATYTLHGVELSWPDDEPPTRPVWMPALDSDTLRKLAAASRTHEMAARRIDQPGKLTLSCLIRSPRGPFTLRFESSATIAEAALGDIQAEPAEMPTAGQKAAITLKAESTGEPLFFSATLETKADTRPLEFKATYRSGSEQTDHPLSSDHILLPWTPAPGEPASALAVVVPNLDGGDPIRGKTLFFGDQARCSQCHAISGQGGKVGPDLSAIDKKDRAAIYRAIAAPSAEIAPAYRSYTIATQDGQIVVGIVRAHGSDSIIVTDTNARTTKIKRAEIQQIRPSATSVMPVGLTGALGPERIRDLVAYLMAQAR